MAKFPQGRGNGLPFFGSALEFRKAPHEFLLQTVLEYGDVATVKLGPTHLWIVADTDLVHEILVKQQKQFLRGDNFTGVLRPNVGDSLIVSEGDYHTRQRKMIQPAFHATRIYNYTETMVTVAEKTLQDWSQNPHRNIHSDMMQLTMEVVIRTLFGSSIDNRDDAMKVGNAIRILQDDITHRFLTLIPHPTWWLPEKRRLAKVEFALELIRETIYGYIRERRAQGTPDTGDLLSMLLLSTDDNGTQMTDDEVYHEAVTLFTAGHETTSHALTWTWHLLSLNPDKEALLHQELETVLKGRLPQLDDLKQLPYTQQVIKESMRLYPPLWALPTRQAQSRVKLGEYVVPEGMYISVSPYVLHRHPRYWENPEKFMPERFAPEKEKLMHKYQYIPFGGGVHTCIGNSFAMMEAPLVLATLAQCYRMSQVKNQKIEPEASVTFMPKYGVKMDVIKR